MPALHNIQCTLSAAIYFICDLYYILIYGHGDSFKIIKEIKQTASMRLAIIPYDITVIYFTYIQMYYIFNAVISLGYVLPKALHEMSFVDCNFIKTKLY